MAMCQGGVTGAVLLDNGYSSEWNWSSGGGYCYLAGGRAPICIQNLEPGTYTLEFLIDSAVCIGSSSSYWLESSKLNNSRTIVFSVVGNSYTATFNAYGGTIPNYGSSRNVQVTVGSMNYCTVPAATRSGYKFLGWYTSPTGGTQVYDASGKAVAGTYWSSAKKWRYNGSVMLYAHWAVNNYTMSLNLNGGLWSRPSSLTDSDITYSSGIITLKNKLVPGNASYSRLLSFKPTKTGYTFAGYWTAASGGVMVYGANMECKGGVYWSADYGNNPTYKYSGNLTLYAHWTATKPTTYTVQFHKYDGSGTTRDQTFKVGEEKSLLWMDSQLGWKREGYEFIGWVPWNPDSKARLCKYVNGQKVKDLAKAGETFHLWAAWKSASSYRVCFNKNDGSGTKMNQVILRNKEATLAWMDSQIEWKRSGYTFQGWAETATGAVKYANGAKVKNLAMNGGTKNLYAIWKATKKGAKYAAADDGAEVCGAADCGVCLVPDGVPVIEGELADGSGVFCLVMGEDGAVLYLGDGEGWAEERCEAAPDGDEVVITIAGEVAYRITFTADLPLLL